MTTWPRQFCDDYPMTAPNKSTYRTASSEEIADEGGRNLRGLDEHYNKRQLGGRVTDVHKPLVAGSEVATTSDVILYRKNGYIMPKEGAIAVGMRQAFEKLVKQHGLESLTPLYVEKGVYMFDFYVEPAKDVCNVEDGQAASSGNYRLAARP